MKKRTPLLITILVALTTVIGVTFALFTSSDSVKNTFKVATVDIEVDEKDCQGNDFKDVPNWVGDTECKKVKIENKSDVDVLIRVNITPRWVEKGTNTPFAGDISLVELNFNENYESYWMNGGDGFYYYRSKVAPGPKTFTEELLKSVKAKNNLPEEYKNKDFKVDVNAEAVVANIESFEQIWNIKDKNSDIYKLLEGICD